jgi:hypothetical protein
MRYDFDMRATTASMVAGLAWVGASVGACGGAESSTATTPTDAAPSIDAPACVPSVDLPAPSSPPSTHADCLANASAFDTAWALKDDAWCVVAHYDLPSTANVGPGHSMTWGRHGGLLQGGGTITRWSAPSGSTGTMTSTVEDVHANLPDGLRWADWAVDLPFERWTALGMEPASSGGRGAILLVRDGEVGARIDADSPSLPVGLVDGDATRILFMSSADTNSVSIRTVDDCHSGTCASVLFESPFVNSKWPMGAIADADGNVFAVLGEGRGAEGTYEQARAFDRSHVGPRTCPTTSALAEINGNVLPAVDGRRIYYGAREFDQGIEAAAYHLDATGAVAFEPYASFVVPKSSGYFGALLVDDEGRLWAASVVGTTVTFFVFARR